MNVYSREEEIIDPQKGSRIILYKGIPNSSDAVSTKLHIRITKSSFLQPIKSQIFIQDGEKTSTRNFNYYIGNVINSGSAKLSDLVNGTFFYGVNGGETAMLIKIPDDKVDMVKIIGEIIIDDMLIPLEYNFSEGIHKFLLAGTEYFTRELFLYSNGTLKSIDSNEIIKEDIKEFVMSISSVCYDSKSDKNILLKKGKVISND